MNSRGVLANPQTWAIVGCGLAIGSVFLVWDVVPIMGLNVPVKGFSFWFGKVMAGLFFALGLALVVTHSNFEPARWHAPIVALAGVALLVFATCYQSNLGNHRESIETTEVVMGGDSKRTQRSTMVSPGSGLYVVQAVGASFLLLAVFIHRWGVRPPDLQRDEG